MMLLIQNKLSNSIRLLYLLIKVRTLMELSRKKGRILGNSG
jgi:hypothetical protein